MGKAVVVGVPLPASTVNGYEIEYNMSVVEGPLRYQSSGDPVIIDTRHDGNLHINFPVETFGTPAHTGMVIMVTQYSGDTSNYYWVENSGASYLEVEDEVMYSVECSVYRKTPSATTYSYDSQGVVQLGGELFSNGFYRMTMYPLYSETNRFTTRITTPVLHVDLWESDSVVGTSSRGGLTPSQQRAEMEAFGNIAIDLRLRDDRDWETIRF
jgi:hypothetical protein